MPREHRAGNPVSNLKRPFTYAFISEGKVNGRDGLRQRACARGVYVGFTPANAAAPAAGLYATQPPLDVILANVLS